MMTEVLSVASCRASLSPVIMYGTDYVVRLEAVCLVAGNAHCVQYLLKDRHLHGQLFRHAFASGLILTVLLMAERRSLAVESYEHVCWLVVGAYLEEHAQKAVYPLGIHAFLCYHGPLDRVVRAVYEAVSVDYYYRIHVRKRKRIPKCRWAIIHALSNDRWGACARISVFH